MHIDPMTLKGNWNYPTSIRFGCGRLEELADACKTLGIKQPLLVTDPGLAKLPMISQATDQLDQAGLKATVFSDVKANPPGENVDTGLKVYQQGKHDGVIAFGGGSALDVGKAIALMVGQSRPLWDFEDVGDNWTRVNSNTIAPIVAVPTTSGTGSEVGRASVLVNTAEHSKKIIFHPKMLPSIVIADPELTVGLPPNITAATGMDALSHNLEAFCSPGFHPMADGIAMEGMRLIKENLELAVAQAENLGARANMMIASSMGATAFQKGLGAMHALAHPLGGQYDAHHGLLNAILMPYVLSHNRSAIEEKMQHLADFLQLSGKHNGFDAILDFILQLRSTIGIPHTLNEIGIGDGKKADIGALAVADPSAGGNPIQFSETQYAELFSDSVHGKL